MPILKTGPSNAALKLELVNEGKEAGPCQRHPARLEPTARDPASLSERRENHTPVGGELHLNLGEAFDITATARRTAFERLSEQSYEFAGEVILRNAKSEEVEVEVVGNLPAGARVLEESTAHELESAQRPLWRIAVPPEGESRLTYRIRVSD